MALVALATLGDFAQLWLVPSASFHPWWPLEVELLLLLFAVSSTAFWKTSPMLNDPVVEVGNFFPF